MLESRLFCQKNKLLKIFVMLKKQSLQEITLLKKRPPFGLPPPSPPLSNLTKTIF